MRVWGPVRLHSPWRHPDVRVRTTRRRLPIRTGRSRSVPGIGDRVYGNPSHFEKDVIRRNVPWLTANAESSISFTPLQYQQGIITPSGVFFERYHAGRPTVDPAQHRLMVHGMVDRPLMFTVDDIKRFPSESRIHFIECPANGGMEWRAPQLNSLQYTHGMIGCSEWTGVKLSTIFEQTGLKPGCEVGASRGCRRRAHGPVHPAREDAGRRAAGLCAETARH